MMRPYRFAAILSVFVLLALACAHTIPATSATSQSLPPGESTRTLVHDGRQRSYILYVPASIDWSQPVPLVFVFHGGLGNAETAIQMSGFNEIADQHGVIVVYPNGTGPLAGDKILTWNGGTCCAYAQENHVDDVGFVRAIVNDLQSPLNVDMQRIYATGMSNGGILAHRLACEAADLFAAVAPVAGTLNFSPCTPSQPISVIEFHGTADDHIPYDGGFGPKSLVDVDFASVQDSVGFWTSRDGCNAQPQNNTFEDTQHDVWTGCAASTAVELYTIIGGGHSWPGGEDTIAASPLIWEFFAAHPKASLTYLPVMLNVAYGNP